MKFSLKMIRFESSLSVEKRNKATTATKKCIEKKRKRLQRCRSVQL